MDKQIPVIQHQRSVPSGGTTTVTKHLRRIDSNDNDSANFYSDVDKKLDEARDRLEQIRSQKPSNRDVEYIQDKNIQIAKTVIDNSEKDLKTAKEINDRLDDLENERVDIAEIKEMIKEKKTLQEANDDTVRDIEKQEKFTEYIDRLLLDKQKQLIKLKKEKEVQRLDREIKETKNELKPNGLFGSLFGKKSNDELKEENEKLDNELRSLELKRQISIKKQQIQKLKGSGIFGRFR